MANKNAKIYPGNPKRKYIPGRGGETHQDCMLNMGQQYTILTLHNQGKTNAEIARQMHCNRHTVENILKRGEVIEKQTRHKPSVVTPYKEQLQAWFNKKDITRRRMHDMLQEEHKVTFSYDALRPGIQSGLSGICAPLWFYHQSLYALLAGAKRDS